MSHYRPFLKMVFFLLAVLMLANCGGMQYYPRSEYGVYHTVQKGQTLYSIAGVYGVALEDLQRINGISNPEGLNAGRKLWIPGAIRVLTVPVTVPGHGTTRMAQPVPKPKRHWQDTLAKPIPPPKTAKKVPPSKSRYAGRSSVRGLLWPVSRGRLTSRFGQRWGKNHDGIDIGAAHGTPIRAAAGGTVKFSGWGPTGYGKMIIIKHPGHLMTVYAHNSKNLVKRGAQVRRGQVIARIGKTGRATGPHLHFEVRNDTHPKNPLLYLRRR